MVSLRWWRRGVSMSTEAARPWLTVTAPLGMWGQQARQARLLPLIFICSTVCFAFKSLAEREALDTPWMAQDHGPLFKDPGSFFKAKGIQDEEGWCLKAKVWSWMGQRVSRQHRLALMKRGALCNNTWSSWRTMLGGWVRGKVTRVHLDGLEMKPRVRQVWNKNKHAQHLPKQPRHPTPAYYSTSPTSNDCNLFHVIGKLAGKHSTSRHGALTGRHFSLQKTNIYLSSWAALLHIPPRHYSDHNPERGLALWRTLPRSLIQIT